MAKWFGVNFPFYNGNTLLGNSTNVAARQEDHRLIKNDLLQGILTMKGERQFRPTFGSDIYRSLFELNDETERSSLKDRIIEQVSKFHPRVVISDVKVEANPKDENMMVVTIFGRTDLDTINVNEVLVRFQSPITGG
jgi:phage baseplate assembly protein W